ncbi:EamA family transporter RarD [Wenxinia saemankumensis]|uniref:Chloramphenicol-sensitive protein RarD n=1 Tax=Wenxinia saemankumensis TaxID=1447782 RepID=A0A1M6DT09_9RHOB|nr:EamA family transporter RarD [Wenxinia saemankumensis]SHI76374.1 chloramphenicol-sensitive protein RarD [Wenxinia saemankumensis]
MTATPSSLAAAPADAAPPRRPARVDTARGLRFALAAYAMWGLLPLYLKALSHVPALEVVAHRGLWSVPVAAAAVILGGRLDALRAALTPRLVAMAALTAALISVNWCVYVWSVSAGRTVDAALGYYINPLFSMFLGWALMGERLSRRQVAAIALAALAVLVLTVESRTVPWVGLTLAATFGFYGYFKAALPLGASEGFLLEVLILAPAAAAILWWTGATGGGAFGGSTRDTLMLAGCGVATAVPLLCYATGARGLTLSTIGILQYTVPTAIFAIAVFVFGEPFGTGRAIAFPLIWAALALYTSALWRRR